MLSPILLNGNALVDAPGALLEIEAFSMGLRYATGIFREEFILRVPESPVVNVRVKMRFDEAELSLIREEKDALFLARKSPPPPAEEVLLSTERLDRAKDRWEEAYAAHSKECDRVDRIGVAHHAEVDGVLLACNVAFTPAVLAIIKGGVRSVGRIADDHGMVITPAGAVAALREWLKIQPRMLVAAVDALWATVFDDFRKTFKPGFATLPWKTLLADVRRLHSRLSVGDNAHIVSAARAGYMAVDVVRTLEGQHLLGPALTNEMSKWPLGYTGNVPLTWSELLDSFSSDAIWSTLYTVDCMTGGATPIRARAAAARPVLSGSHYCHNIRDYGKCVRVDCQFPPCNAVGDLGRTAAN